METDPEITEALDWELWSLTCPPGMLCKDCLYYKHCKAGHFDVANLAHLIDKTVVEK